MNINLFFTKILTNDKYVNRKYIVPYRTNLVGSLKTLSVVSNHRTRNCMIMRFLYVLQFQQKTKKNFQTFTAAV